MVCQEGRSPGKMFCRACSTSYDRHIAKDDGTLLSAYAWVARRARAFERRRAKRKKDQWIMAMKKKAKAGGEGMAPLCTGYEVVCPDGRVRHYPFHNRGDAESTARLAGKRRCRLWPDPSPLELSQPPCPEGEHTVRLAAFQEPQEQLGRALSSRHHSPSRCTLGPRTRTDEPGGSCCRAAKSSCGKIFDSFGKRRRAAAW